VKTSRNDCRQTPDDWVRANWRDEGSRPVSAQAAEQALLRQLQTKERPEQAVLWDLAYLYSHAGQQNRAFDLVQAVVEKVATLEEKAGCYLAMGQLQEQMKNYEMAIRYYRQALALEPVSERTWYFIHNNLGYCLNHFGRFAEAEPYCRHAIAIDPLRYNAHKNLGVSLEGLEDYAGAAMCYIESVLTNAADPRALRHLEQLAQKHPIVTIDLPDFDVQLKACRSAVQEAGEAPARRMQGR
jgi:tetratricopeptide (TPR) repeat protein